MGIPKGLAPGAVFGDFLQKQKVTRSEAELSPPEADTDRKADTDLTAATGGKHPISNTLRNFQIIYYKHSSLFTANGGERKGTLWIFNSG